jgi:hypothetical protein
VKGKARALRGHELGSALLCDFHLIWHFISPQLRLSHSLFSSPSVDSPLSPFALFPISWRWNCILSRGRSNYHLESNPHPRHTTLKISAMSTLDFEDILRVQLKLESLAVLDALEEHTEHSLPFLRRVNRREAPDYYFGKYRQTSQMEFINKQQLSNILWISAP